MATEREKMLRGDLYDAMDPLLVDGVTIGDDTTIGAGSVVLRDVPEGVLAAGNPCRVLRTL